MNSEIIFQNTAGSLFELKAGIYNIIVGIFISLR